MAPTRRNEHREVRIDEHVNETIGLNGKLGAFVKGTVSD